MSDWRDVLLALLAIVAAIAVLVGFFLVKVLVATSWIGFVVVMAVISGVVVVRRLRRK